MSRPRAHRAALPLPLPLPHTTLRYCRFASLLRPPVCMYACAL